MGKLKEQGKTAMAKLQEKMKESAKASKAMESMVRIATLHPLIVHTLHVLRSCGP